MATKQADLFAALAAPFEGHEVKVRSQAGRQLHYITARTAMNRLDEVLGPENWWDEYFPHENSVLCRLTIRLPDGSLLTKSDAGGYAGMSDSGDDDKSGYSDAFKRACVKFGVARYLYRDGVPGFVRERVTGAQPSQDAEPPPETYGPGHGGEVPNDQQPARQPPQRQSGASRDGNGQGGQNQGPPRSGKGMFAWCKEMEQKYQVGLIKYMNQWAKIQEFPGRMVDWDAEQVALAHKEAVRKLAAYEQNRGPDAYEEALSN